jgi:pilus assembly protein CpaB
VGNRRTLIAGAAIVLAAAAGFLVYLYVSNADTRAEADVETVQAFVATGDIPKGMSGEAALSDGLIDAEDVLRGSVPPSAVTDTSLLDGKIAASTISNRQFITNQSFVAPSEGGGGSLAAAIGNSGQVAVTVSVDPERGVAGQIAPGDRVDILVVNEGLANYILNDVKVLAVGAQTAAGAINEDSEAPAAAAEAGLITFELSPDDAAQVVAANKSGTLYLTLRPIGAGKGTGDSSAAATGP